MRNAVTFRLIDAGAHHAPDRAPGFDAISLSAEASALYNRIIARLGAVTIEDLATLAETAARNAAPAVAMEIAGMASAVARELMRGRRCETS